MKYFMHFKNNFKNSYSRVVGNEPKNVYDMLMKNFEKSYNGKTRAPIGIYISPAWFMGAYSFHYDGYKMFLDEITKKSDVWIVPIRDGLEYFQNGTLTNDQLINNDFESFNCDQPPQPEDCIDNICM